MLVSISCAAVTTLAPCSLCTYRLPVYGSVANHVSFSLCFPYQATRDELTSTVQGLYQFPWLTIVSIIKVCNNYTCTPTPTPFSNRYLSSLLYTLYPCISKFLSIHIIVISLSVITFRMRFWVSKPASFRYRNSDREPDSSTMNPRNIELRPPTPNKMTLATNDHIYVGGR